jgi:membrane-bound ClpP family serine protease
MKTENRRGGIAMTVTSWFERAAGHLFIFLAAVLVLAGFTWLATPSAPAQEIEDGEFITVTNPITSDVANRVKEQTERIRLRRGGPRVITKIVYDFNPNNNEAATPEWGPCYELAKYIRGLHEFTTVAYVHNKVSRHTVLPVLACRDLVLAGTPETRIGEILPDPNSRPDPLEILAYAQTVGEAKVALILKMMDPRITVLEGRKNNAVYYVDQSKQAEAAAAGVVGIKPEPVLPGGKLALLSGDEAVRLGLCKLTNKDSRQQVAEAYGMSASSVRDDPLQGRNPVAWHIEIKGNITPALRETIERRIGRAVGEGANVIFIELVNCGGTDVDTARKMAAYFQELHRGKEHQAPVMTVAFIPHEAPGAATFLALGCSEIVMRKDATLGDFNGFFQPAAKDPRRRGREQQQPEAPNTEAVSESLQALARDQGISPVLAAGMLDPNLEIFRARSVKGGMSETRFMSAKELEDDAKTERQWRQEDQIKHKGQPLKLDGERAKSFGVARYVVDSDSVREAYAKYGVDPDKVKNARPDWLDAVAEFLREPYVSVALVMIGILCLVLELKIPGVTAPGVIAALCFVLFFWSHALNGQIILLAILLFLLGLVLIGIEIFVLPGFGFVGVSGVVLMVVGLGLATVEHMPQSSGEWLTFGSKLGQFGLGLVIALVGAIVFAHYLPHIPVANRLILLPPGERSETGEEPPALPGVEQATALLGATGTAATMLRPAGMARFGEQYVDVVSEGGFVPAGSRVQVVEVEGNRIVVKEV